MILDRPTAPNPYDLLPPVAAFTVSSVDVHEGKPLSIRHAHTSVGGENVSPHLRWLGHPEATRGFVLTCFDPDAPTCSGFWHWSLVGIPATITDIPTDAGAHTHPVPGAFHVRNDFGRKAYDGSAPPAGDRPHRYIFAVHALDVDMLDVTDDVPPAVIGFHLTFHTIARATLTATFQVP